MFLTIFGSITSVIGLTVSILLIRRLVKAARRVALDGSLLNITLSYLVRTRKLLNSVSNKYEFYNTVNSALVDIIPSSLCISDSVDTGDPKTIQKYQNIIEQFAAIPPTMSVDRIALMNKLIGDSRDEIEGMWGGEWHAIYVLLFPSVVDATKILVLDGVYTNALTVNQTVAQLFARFPGCYSCKVVLAPGVDITILNN